MKIQLKNVRLAFPALFEAKTVNGEGDPAFSASLLIDAKDPQIKAIREAQEKIGADKWGAKWASVRKEIEAKDRFALHDGDLKDKYDGFAGNFFVSARNKTRPTVIDRDRSPLTEQDGRPYAGCYVNAIVELWPQDNNYGKRVNASLLGVQFLRDGDAFTGGRPAAADEFDDLGVDNEVELA